MLMTVNIKSKMAFSSLIFIAAMLLFLPQTANLSINTANAATSSSSFTQIQAKNSGNSIYHCATGDKGVIISPGSFNFKADKKNGKWTGTLSISGTTGSKAGHISSAVSKGISYTFKGNLDTKNTLCHFPGLQSAGTVFELGLLTCGTIKNIKYTELSNGNVNTFKTIITCK